jgi:hypothetical protein
MKFVMKTALFSLFLVAAILITASKADASHEDPKVPSVSEFSAQGDELEKLLSEAHKSADAAANHLRDASRHLGMDHQAPSGDSPSSSKCGDGEVLWGDKCIPAEHGDSPSGSKCKDGEVLWGDKCIPAEHGDSEEESHDDDDHHHRRVSVQVIVNRRHGQRSRRHRPVVVHVSAAQLARSLAEEAAQSNVQEARKAAPVESVEDLDLEDLLSKI